MKSQTSKYRLLTVVAVTVLATAFQNRISAEDPQIFFPSSNTKYKAKYENPPPPAKKLPKKQAPAYQNGASAEQQAVKYKGPQYYPQHQMTYDVWHRPGEAIWTALERCQPRKWCPRGYGDLGMKPKSGYRLDYHRYTLKDTNTIHGPAFYQWSKEPRRCCDIEECDGKCGCESCQPKKLFNLKLFR